MEQELPSIFGPLEVGALAVLYVLVINGVEPVPLLVHGFVLLRGQMWRRRVVPPIRGGSPCVSLVGEFAAVRHLEPSVLA